VIDPETDSRIESVVILSTGITVTITPAGGYITSMMRETVTDKNGDFRIKGLGLKILIMLSQSVF